MASLTITIEVTGGEQTVLIKDDSGNEKKVTGFVMFGYSPVTDELYGFSWGSAVHSAMAVVEVVARACNAGDGWMQEFYHSLLSRFIKATGVPAGREVSAEDVLSRWEKEDVKTWN